MPGTVAGGRKAAATNKAKDPNFYRRIGKIGGSAPSATPGGFGSDLIGEDGLTGRERARIAGSRGGQVSKRKKRAKDAS